MTDHDAHYTFRDQLVERLQQDLLGPSGGEHEVLDDAPLTTYITGVLFPIRDGEDTSIADEQTDREGHVPDAEVNNDETPDTGVAAANIQSPRSTGITLAVDPEAAKNVQVTVSTAVYEPEDSEGRPVQSVRSEARSTEDRGVRWRRRPLSFGPIEIDVRTPDTWPKELGDGLELRVRVRRATGSPSSVAVTVSLVNTRKIGRTESQDAHCFFQPLLSVESTDGTPCLVERPVPVGADEEEVHVNNMLYRYAPQFAVGHGCAADWEWTPPPPRDDRLLKGRPAAVTRVRTAFVPSCEVLLTASNPDIDDSGLGMATLGSEDTDTVAALDGLVRGYRKWISLRAEEARLLRATEYGRSAQEQVRLCREACDRMAAGVELLREDPKVLRAFRLANRAMALQRARTIWIRSGRQGEPTPAGSWRPFQVAFVLLCLNGVVDPDHDDRDVADLLWFPTGGGKTEAYLGLIAFTVFFRRARLGAQGGGVTALMRYTLRLLTLQQFERAAALICAMEVMRSRAPAELGTETISLGMWVGRAATPNRVEHAQDALQSLRGGKSLQTMNPVQVRSCPWCGTRIDAYDYEAFPEEKYVRIRCPGDGCHFADGIPVHVVDEVVYEVRPTLVIATVDKFAQISWRKDVAALFNRDSDDDTPPPELIVQDELHLISGPLGSLTGLYETAVDAAAGRPKVIASTATIRRAQQQARHLFDRQEVRQFPPGGLDARDSWFAVEAPAQKMASRLYVGLLTPITSQATLLVRTYSSLLHNAFTVEGPDKVRDAYWTLVGYFNSLRLLAAAELQVHDDVQDRLQHLAERDGLPQRTADLSAELTSRIDSSEVPARLRDLQRGLPEEGTFDTVLATNMISVGVDIDRLGLMAIMGQPQTTAEYIQASSRVGRRHPGLVTVLLNGARSRDRSHYEHFRSYHSALYREVESTSVTPFSARARDRALHAVVVGLARMLYPEARPNHAAADMGAFEHRLKEIRDLILRRVERVCPEELDATAKDLDHFFAEWRKMAAANPNLVYEARPVHAPGERRAHDAALLRSHSDEDLEDAFPTLWSMRDVDVESHLYLGR